MVVKSSSSRTLRPSVRRTQLLVLAVALSIGIVVSALAMIEQPDEASLPFVVSNHGDDEILFLTWHGGLGTNVPEYYLYGDGRVVRLEVNQAHRDQPLDRQEHTIDRSQILTLMDLVSSANMAAVSESEFRESIGNNRSDSADAIVVQLRASYLTHEAALGPLVVEYSIVDPWEQAERTPQLRQPEGLVLLVSALRAIFESSENQ